MARYAWRLACLVLVTPLVAADQEARVDLGPWQTQQLTTPPVPGAVRRVRLARLRFGPVAYGIQCRNTVSPTDPAFCDVGEGPVGLPEPMSEGWYGGGCIDVTLNGKRLDTVPVSSFETAESGARAMADLVWHAPDADLRYRFIGLPGEDRLYLQIDFAPRVEVKAAQIHLKAYPSYFTSWNKRAGARRTAFPGGVVKQDEKRTLPVAEAPWALLYDETFDVARGEGRGPSGVAVLPDGVKQVTIEPHSYPSFVTLDLEPGCRRVRLALWEFPGRPNAEVLTAFPAAAAAALETLRTLDVTPESLRTFDPAALAAALAEARRQPALVKQLGPKLDRLEAWLKTCQPLFDGPRTEPDITAGETFLAGWSQQQDVLWEVRLAQLLDF